jgi:hypothetical protein
MRYDAACSAALAAADLAEDAKTLPDKVTVKLRHQALRWLRADRELNENLALQDDPAAKQLVRQRMSHWQQDRDLAPMRDKDHLDRLPEDECTDWRTFWSDVATLRKQVEKK